MSLPSPPWCFHRAAARSNRTNAGIKTAQADVLDGEATQLLEKAQATEKVAARLQALLEEPA